MNHSVHDRLVAFLYGQSWTSERKCVRADLEPAVREGEVA
ncbi:hypothetical protein BEI_3728 [Halomonas beimenensis]|uniref:Uncharacterized protein n=1 Tax=Halomonas beimenensis TaxID=475662 RepID=A0A291PCZ0_9GAMM|nr:hypothetical protein BEI_3728 [Halomonas beimenensis]